MSIEARTQPPAGRIVLTYEDYCGLPDDGKRYEIIWLADPEMRVLEVYELSEGQYRRAASLAGDDTFSPPLLPGLTFPLSSLWG